MDRDTLLMIVIVPVFMIGLQKYIEIRANYEPPTKYNIEKIRARSGEYMSKFVRIIPRLKYSILTIAILNAYGFGFSIDYQWKWAFVAGMVSCIIAMSLLVNWKMIARP